jgi:hypothetical protein
MSNRNHPWLAGTQSGIAWTWEALGSLRDLYPDHTPEQMSVLLGRTEDAVKHKLRELELPTWARGIEPALVSATLAAELAAARSEAGAMCEAASDARGARPRTGSERERLAANWPRQPRHGLGAGGTNE